MGAYNDAFWKTKEAFRMQCY